jgi:c-di-GMP-binding flagellar brake protein YcgR
VGVAPETVAAIHERRRRRRVAVMPMYTSVVVRILSMRMPPLEGHLIDLSETGMALELDALIPVGQPVTVEFRAAGLGAVRQGLWAEYAATAEVVRHDSTAEFPGGPYRIAVRFAQVSTMTQAQIARYVASHIG